MRLPTSLPLVQVPRTAAATVDIRPLVPTSAGTLGLDEPDAIGRRFVSAASGLAGAGGATWAVSDEYGELIRLDRLGVPGRLLPGLSAGEKKPDLEALVRIPSSGAGSSATLLALGSGSSGHRHRGVAQDVDEQGRPVGVAREVDLKPLHAELEARLPFVPNIEGAAWRDAANGAELLLFHRGKLDRDSSAVFRLDGAAVLDALRGGRAIPASAILEQRPIELGSMGGVRLGFSDARALPDGRIAFAASAEGDDATGDGVILGSVVGMLDANLAVTALRRLAGAARKVEGIERARELDPTAPKDRFVLVTDADDPARPAEVLTVELA